MRITPPLRQSLFLLFFSFSTGFSAIPEVRAELLPEIEASTSSVIPVEASKSLRVYRFKIQEGEAPKAGSIILIQSKGKPIMAFRVLRTEEDGSEFIGKRVRRYDTEGELKLEESYLSAEKVANLFSPPPIENRFDPNAKPELDPIGGVDLHPPSKDTEFKLDPNAPPLLGAGGGIVSSSRGVDVNSFDSDLDYGTSPRDLKRNSSEDEDDAPPQGERSGSEVDETPIFNPHKNMVGISIGNFRNLSSFLIPGTTHNGFSVWYQRVIQKGLWVYGRKLQDALSLEFGVTHYSRVNFTGNNDGYDLLPLKAELAYSLNFNPRFAFLVHVGLQYNWIYATDNVNPSAFPAEQQALNTLAGIQPTLGAGVLYNIGPQWFVRAEAGLDRLTIGLAVKW